MKLFLLFRIQKESGQFTYESATGEDVIVIYDTIEANNWKLAAVVPENEILNKVDYIKHSTVFILMMVVSAIFLTSLVGKYISKPFEKMAEHMRTINKT